MKDQEEFDMQYLKLKMYFEIYEFLRKSESTNLDIFENEKPVR